MNLSEVTMEQLQAENPELFESIRQQGVTEERERMAEIDALTDEGFEELAQEAKANGTAAADFLKQVVSQRQGKKKAFLDARKDETGAAQQVAGGAAADNDGDDGDEIARNAREMAELAKGLNLNGASMY